MTLFFQILVGLFILYSFAMVIAVPVAYALPSNWNQTRPLILLGSILWVLFVIVIGILNSFVV
ncbi:MAG: photosystem II reaction center protein PsbZ [Pseudanabaenaceae cyanobacterium SKYGB_i_bin29]|nr:photosystem II reaction center protein PsbZ [Pseudanabaenaceae cyanobacterium SKYG29]MDW8421450.1 photosystem II reaction center protein PsbZ [Pseudanabaenaceae cyanobacterium SKYGB_i_bin29]